MAGVEKKPCCPRLIYNSDGDSTTLLAFPPPITPEQACRDIEELVGTRVEVFTNSMGRGDETFSHPTDFGDIYGAGVSEWPEGENVAWVRIMAENTRALLDAGINIIDLLAERAHERGLQFWPALRMNDIHEDDGSRFAAFRSSFKKRHPELLIGSPYPQKHGYGYPQDDFTWAFDFAREEVRQRKLGLILETCQNYDVDGFELDFQRGAWYFKDGQEGEGLPLMTDFMRQVREKTGAIAARKGRPFTLMLRVPPTVEKCRAIGLDVPTWIKEELADLFILMDKTYLDMGADIRGFVELAQGTCCKIGGGLEHICRGYGDKRSIPAGSDILYAGALSYWHQGASCIYLFNYDCHRQAGGDFSYTPDEYQVLREIHDPELIARKNKRYWVTVDLNAHTPAQGGLMPLPVELAKAGAGQNFNIWIGDDIEGAKSERALDDIWLRLTCSGYEPEAIDFGGALNGIPLAEAHCLETPRCTTLTYRDIAPLQGENQLTLSLERLAPGRGPLRIETIELVITYK